MSTTPDPAELAQLARHAFDGTLFIVAGQPASAWALVELALVLPLAVWLGGYLLRLSSHLSALDTAHRLRFEKAC